MRFLFENIFQNENVILADENDLPFDPTKDNPKNFEKIIFEFKKNK